MLAKMLWVSKGQKCPDWSGTMTPDVYRSFCSVASFHHGYTAGSDFLHSKQNSFERDINPQDGHIVCDPKQAVCGLLIPRADALKFLNERVTKVGSVRKRGQNGRKTGSMVNPHFYRLRRGPSRKA